MVVLFDLDGVVLDTESQYTVLWNNIGKKYGDVGEIGRLSKGQTLTHILDTYFKGQTELQKHIIKELYEFEQNMSYAPIPGVMVFMKQLKAASVPTAVVTSSNKAKMENVYRHYPDFKDIVGHVFTSESFTRSKPDPECFLMAMHALGGTPEDTVVFEDSVNGLKAARASGATVVGLVTSNPREVVEPLSDYAINDFTSMSLDRLKEMLQVH